MSNGDPLAWLFNFVHPFAVTVTCTSSGNHVPTSWHYAHRAVDVAGTPPEMRRLASAALRNPTAFKEVFYDPMGRYVKNGTIRKGAIGGHADHVHLAR